MENNINNLSEEKDNGGEVFNENIENNLKAEETEPKKSKITPIFVSLAIFIVALVALGLFLLTNSQKQQEVDTILVIEPRELTINMNSSAQVRVYLQGADVNSREDITNQIEWYTNNPDLFVIGNDSVKGQVITKDQEGEGFITMIYGEQTEIIPVKIIKAGLSVECYPLLAEEWTKEGIKTAKVGDAIDWIGFYTEIGSPHYDYKWTGTGGLDSDSAIATKIYKTSGLKEVHFWTKDTAGTIAEADCSITIIK